MPDNNKSTVRLFTDDCVIYRKVNSVLDVTGLRNNLNSLNSLANINEMKTNGKKIKLISFTKGIYENKL